MSENLQALASRLRDYADDAGGRFSDRPLNCDYDELCADCIAAAGVLERIASGAFFSGQSLAELAEQQGVKPVRDVRELAVDVLADEVDVDTALDATRVRTAGSHAPNGELLAALRELRINANRLCDRNQGGTYEEDCRRSIARADAALTGAEQPTCSTWQPIETAPRDFTPVLLFWLPVWGEPIVVLARWLCRKHSHQSSTHGCPNEPDCDMGWDSYAGQMTHWMSLPNPPSKAGDHS